MIWFDRYRDPILAANCALLMMALHFAFVIVMGGNPITPELYGPAVYVIPALVWAGAQMGGALVSILGVLIDGKLGGLFLAVGSLIQFAFYLYLAVAGSMAAQGVVVTAGSLWLTAPMAFACCVAGFGRLMK